MTEVGHADLSRLLQSKRNECNAIVTSRKRKLRELFAVATQTQPLPDAPIATSAEWQFLHKNDILHEKVFEEASIPPRPQQSVEALKRTISAALIASGNSPANSPVATTPTTSNSTTSARSTPAVQSPANSQIAPTPAQTIEPSPAALTARSQHPTNHPNDGLRRPGQVSFPPGTKGSPSSTPTPVANGVTGVTPTTDGSLSIKLPHDAAKVTDGMSSPGSTAASATTTAAHDISANTSPDHEGPRSPEVIQQPVQAAPKLETKPTAVGEKPQTSDEDQLLQESIRSAAASGSEDEAPATTPPTSKPQTNTSEPPTAEVPDSQDESDKMDIDVPETIKDSINVRPPPPLLTPQPTRESVPAERAVTRVSSGAMRLKSVNEIVGATPRSGIDRSTPKDIDDQLTPSASVPESPAARSKSRKDRKGKMSTVLFGKQPKRVEEKAVAAGQKEQLHPFDDYYTPLFIQNFTGATNWMQPIEKILFHANKTIGTSDANIAILDNQACKVLRRVYHLQQHDKWSLRQPKRCPEPTRPSSQWDVMLQEMKWMRTDYREERKWKMTIARNLAYACLEWIESNAEERLALQVVARIPPKVADAGPSDTQIVGESAIRADDQPTPDLEPSGDADTPLHDDISEVFAETVAPSAIFSLQEDDVVFGLRRTPAADLLLDELPMYGAPLKVPRADAGNPEFDPDAHWRRPALPLSKYVEGEMKVTNRGPPRKRSRFDYWHEDSDNEDDVTFTTAQAVSLARNRETASSVALFNPESKPIRDRLHAGHQFRPPSEHPMPLQSFYECRSASQWTLAEDDELKGLVREYSYNWSLISSMLTTRSTFLSGPERRTPWECFERWINLEGLPADMQKTQYFKAYNSRIEAAQRVIAQQNQIAAQQASAAGNNIPPLRRRPSVPVRVERRRNQKHLTLIDCMRKLAKKRETAQQKQQHTASQNPAKKSTDLAPQRPSKTPRDYSLLRFERDQALADKMAQFAVRQEANRRAQMAARAQSQAAQQIAGAAQGAQPNQGTSQATAAAAAQGGAQRAEVPAHVVAAAAAAAAGQRPRVQPQPAVNGASQVTPGMPSPAMVAAAAQLKGITGVQLQAALQAQAQAHIQAQAQAQQQRMPMPNQQADANLMLRAQQISNQQRAAVQIQQQQQVHHQQQRPNSAVQQNGQASPPMANGANGMHMNNAQAMMAAYNANNANRNGGGAAGMHMQNGVAHAGSMSRIPALPPNIALQLTQLEAQFRAKNPSLTPEQSRQLATEHLTRAMMAQRQSALNAAAGVTVQPGLANSIAATTSPHQYAALLRQQQQQQAAAAAAAQQRQQQQQPNGQPGQQGQVQQQQQQQQHTQGVQLSGNNAAGSPIPQTVHQRQPSGSATPSSTGN